MTNQRLKFLPQTRVINGPRSDQDQDEKINYRYIYRGSVVLAYPEGAVVRIELYKPRRLERLSLRN